MEKGKFVCVGRSRMNCGAMHYVSGGYIESLRQRLSRLLYVFLFDIKFNNLVHLSLNGSFGKSINYQTAKTTKNEQEPSPAHHPEHTR